MTNWALYDKLYDLLKLPIVFTKALNQYYQYYTLRNYSYYHTWLTAIITLVCNEIIYNIFFLRVFDKGYWSLNSLYLGVYLNVVINKVYKLRRSFVRASVTVHGHSLVLFYFHWRLDLLPINISFAFYYYLFVFNYRLCNMLM